MIAAVVIVSVPLVSWFGRLLSRSRPDRVAGGLAVALAAGLAPLWWWLERGGASKVYALPRGGFMVVGELGVRVVAPDGSSERVLFAQRSLIKAVGAIDEEGTRWLLGNSKGELFLLALGNGEPGAAMGVWADWATEVLGVLGREGKEDQEGT